MAQEWYNINGKENQINNLFTLMRI